MTMTRGRYVRPFPTGSAPAPVDRLAEAYRSLLVVPEASGTRADALAKDPNFTAVGRNAELRRWASEGAIPSLKKGREAMAAGERAIAELRGKMATAAIDKTDVAAAIVRSEVRSWLREMEPVQRTARLAAGGLSSALAQAILEAPPELSGVTTEQWTRLEAQEVIALHPEEAAAVMHIEEALAAVADADRAASLSISKDAGFTPGDLTEALGGLTLSERLQALAGGEAEPEAGSE